MNIIQLIGDFKNNNSMLWVEKNNIKLFVANQFQGGTEIIDTIKKFKPEIVDYLVSNKIFSKEDFQKKTIFKSNGNKALLSFAQQRLWFIELYEGSNAYHIPRVSELGAGTDLEGIKYALQQIVSRHEVLRSTIEHGDGEEHGIQQVHDEPLAFGELILTDKDDFETLIQEDVNRPFDLGAEYPIRVKFYTIQSTKKGTRNSQDRTVLLVNFHHIASDAWSIEIFEREWAAYYEAYCNNDTAFSLAPLEIQYKDYALWQRSYLSGEILEKQLSYWKNKLMGYQTLELPTDYARPTGIDYRGSSLRFKISAETSQKLRALAQRNAVTIYSTLLSSINILLGKFTGQEDIITGSVIANRHHRQTEELIGFFVNTQVNRTLLDRSQSFEDLIQQVHQEQVQAQLYQDLPFEKLVEELNVERDLSRHPVFQVMFGIESFAGEDEATNEQETSLKLPQVKTAYEVEKFDLTIHIDDSRKKLMGRISYATALFHKDTIERLIGHYTCLLEQLTEAPQHPYSQHSLLSPEQYEQIVYDWNATDKEYPREKTIHQLFQEQAKKTPDNIALVYEGQALSYTQLNEKSNQLARHIREQYLQKTKQSLAPDTLIALYLDRSLEMVIGILAVLKAGGAYVPMDIHYPQESIDHILADTQAEIILSQRQLSEGSHSELSPDKVIYIDPAEKFYQEQDTSNLPQHSKATDLAYLIYTSGSTGKQKGVMVEHRSVSSLIYNDYIKLSRSDVFAFLSSPVFDAATFEIWAPLLNGNTLAIPKDLKTLVSDINAFKTFIACNHVSILWLTKTLFESLFHFDNNIFKDLNYLITGGEALDKHVIDKLVNSRAKPKHFLNGYGPTESTTFTCVYDLSNQIVSSNVPIGKPIKNRSVYVLYPNLNPVPIGITGELYIAGAGLARGYLNKNELTEERFIANPFATESDRARGHARLYKTGDLVRWLADGNLEYIGRNDDQVKIRGFRIELGEIEQALSKINGIRQCCVLAKERNTASGSNKYLVAYYVLDNAGEILSPANITEKLSQALPEYMIPAALVAMESFPLTINGKLDRNALPEPDFTSSQEEYVAPKSYTETLICNIWEEALGLDQVGITDNFFRIGGNSILAIQVSHRMSKTLNCDVQVADIFKYKTISQLQRHSIGQAQTVIPAGDIDRGVLSFAQERLWFIEQYEQGSNAYHVPLVLTLDADTNLEGIKYALQQIVSRHEVLRSTIEHGDGEEHSIQQVHDEPLSFGELILTDKDDFETLIQEDINRPFDLSAEYPIRVKFYTIQSTKKGTRNSQDRTVLLINFHHIASDAWSIEIFEREWAAYYEAYCNNDTAFSLAPLEIQYKDYALWQRSYLSGEILEKQLSYWKDKLMGYQTLELPTDYARPAEIDYSGSSQEFVLNEETSQKLRALAQYYGVTLYSVLLSSINILLGKFTGQEDIITGSVIANRHHRQTEELIGFFVNTQVNRTLLDRSQSFEDLIQQVHQEQIQAQLYQDLPFEKLVEELNVERDLSRHPVFQVMFGIESFASEDEATNEPQTSLKLPQVKTAYEIEKFDLTIDIDVSWEEIIGRISYATALFHKDTIERLIGHYTCLLEQLTEAPQHPYSQHSLLSPEQYEQIVYDWNATDKEYPREKTIHQLFQEQAKKTPDNIALVYEGQALSYTQLNEKSNQLARHIREQYLQKTKQSLAPDTLIALYLDRSLEMVIGILAVLKAGGAYVPMDIHYPQESIDHILADTQAEIILSQRQLSEGSHSELSPDKVIYIDPAEKFYQEQDASNLPQHSKATDLAYLIYTSGSTGKQKAVEIEHKSVVNMALGRVVEYEMTETENCLQTASICFDASVEQIFVALFSGARLTMIKKEILIDGEKCELFLNENKITHLDTIPSFLETLDFSKLQSLKRIASGGESCTVELVNRILPYIEFYNEYGPTEATVIATQYKLEKGEKVSEVIPIGKPIHNVKLFILDNYLNTVPVGITGELYIGGDCLGRGYLNSEKLTEEKFIPNPFGEGKLYKTDDLVRWLPDGNLEYIGRKDDQVKIRGFRIELGEIEHALSQIKGIRQCCVLAKERKTETGNIRYLVGYYVPDPGGGTLSQTDITEKLSLVLPEYMIPATLVAMGSLPLTFTGKLDKRALPDPDFSDEDNYIKPNTELEIRLCQIYASVLGLPSDQISTHQNFFRMGGNSILSIQLKGKLNRLDEFKHITVADLFKYNSINKLIRSIQTDAVTEYKQPKNTPQSYSHEIAIVGVSGAFSGANNVAELWQLITNQLEGIRFYSKEECKELGIDDTLLEDHDFIPVEGKVEDIDLFDPSFWEMSPNEAKQLDPQIRKFIEHCWFALESSGYVHERKNHHIGVFAGSGYSNYFYEHILHGELSDQINHWEASTANDKDALATKTAFLLGLTGPANSINTACSTGLVSVVEACRHLMLGTCNMALAGGVSLSMPYQIGYFYEEGMISSKDGHCRTFDKESSGITGGSGVAVVLLKRLDDAIKDNDPILAVIKGYATNNDGDRKTGYTAPSVIGQSECIINAMAMAGISADQIDYVECHGTATHLGDPIEVQALREAFQYNHPHKNHTKHKTVLGAIKANIGHTDSAAGTAGLIKVVAMLQHNIMPGQVNYNEPNPELQLDLTNFEIIKQNRAWPARTDRQRLAGVSSFGVGGTNAHVVIGDYIAGVQHAEISSPSLNGTETPSHYIIPVSARSRQSLELYKQALVEYITESRENNPTLRLQDIAYTSQERREHFNYRTAYCVRDLDELVSKLYTDTSYAEINNDGSNRIVFMFPGQGSQYYNMAKGLYDSEEFFRNTVDQLISIANQHLPTNLFDVIYPLEKVSTLDIDETQWTQICLFIIEYSLAQYLEHLGVHADAYIGHSIGEYVAASLSGVFTLEEAIKLVSARGRLMQSMQPGSMLAINAGEEVVKRTVHEHSCEIAVINSIEDIVVSGEDRGIKALREALNAQGIATVILNTSHAYHSKMMDQAATTFLRVFDNIQLNKPNKNFVSNVSGEIAGEEITHPEYWCKQLRNTVQFAKGIDSLSKIYNHHASFIEVGTGKGLSSFVNKYKNLNRYKVIQTVQLLQSSKEKNAIEAKAAREDESKGDIIATLWMNGIITKPNVANLFAHAKLQTDLPAYQFNYQKCWIEQRNENGSANQLSLLSKEKWFSAPVWSAVSNLDKYNSKAEPIFKNALVFIRKDQLNLFEFANLANDIQLIILDIHESSKDIIDSSGIISVNPEKEHHFEKLGKLIKAKNISFDAIIHISSIENKSNLNDALCYSFYSLFLIRQHLLTNTSLKKLLVLTNGLSQITNEDIINPTNGTLVGAVRNVNHEYINIDARVIDVGSELLSIHPYLSQIFNNTSYQKSEELLAIRFGKLWKQNFESIERTFPLKTTIHDEDIILVTGGLGSIALSVAQYISTQHNVNFILVSRKNILEAESRSENNNEKISIIEEIKKNGSSVNIICADIYNIEQVHSLVDTVKRNIGNITGIIHTAGVSPLGTDEYSLENIKDAFKGKVYGIDNIINNVDLGHLRFLVSTSSLASIMGDVNRIEYCASNSFLDYLAVDKLTFKNTKIISINWPGWLDIGTINSGEDIEPIQQLEKQMLFNSVGHKEGSEIFYQLICQTNYEQVIVSKLDINWLKNNLFKQYRPQSQDIQITILEDEYSDSEYQVAQIIGEALGIQEISIHDDFFKLGGNSIIAIQVSHRISSALGCDIKVADLFKFKCISQLITHGLGQTELVIPKTDSNSAILSFAQERLWFIEQYEQGTNAYHIPDVFELADETDIEGIKYSLQQIVSRHEVLRSTIEHRETGEWGIQRVHEEPLLFEETRVIDTEDLEALIKEDINRPFDLSTMYPIRVKFYIIPSGEPAAEHQPGRTILLINFHHIATDAWSTEIFQRELFSYYDAYVNNDMDFSLPDLEIQYKDYAKWQRTYFTGEVLEKQLSYWKNKLSGFQTLELPTDYARPAEVDYAGASQGFRLNREISKKLRGLAQRHGVTLFSVMLSSINILLSKYTGQEDIITGSVIANRHPRQTEELIGFFVNTQANRTLLSKSQSFDELIQQVHLEQTQAQLYQDLPFEKLVDELGVERDASRHPVFQLMFIVNSFASQNMEADDEKNYLTPFETEDVFEVEKFDLSIFISDGHQEITGVVSYATALFNEETIERFIHYYTHLLAQLTSAPELPYSKFNLLSPEEYELVVYEWNDTDKDNPTDRTIVELFQDQVTKAPDEIALIYEGQHLSYRQLDEKSNQLARYIRDQYLQRTNQSLAPDTLIPLCLDRSLEMVLGILAVMKAGGAYVPIDINYPYERINFLLEETRAELILSQKHVYNNNGIQLPMNKVLAIDLSEEFYNDYDTSNLPQYSHAKDLACILFTSGTTGQPKGVMLEHQSVRNRVVCMISYSGITFSDYYLFKTNYVFDVSLSDIFTHLCAGARLHVTKYSFDLNELNKLLLENKFTSLHLVPSQYDLVSETIKQVNLQKIYFSGEALTEQILADLDQNLKVYNYYGPTETGEITVASEVLPGQASVIGTIFSDSRQYVLDQSQNPVAIGVIGELYLGGAGLARGYLNRPDLTEMRFISNPFSTEAGNAKGYTRLYKTGDLVRWLSDGNLEYIGRNDDQVKINGHRVELAEVEHALSRITGISQCCVLAREIQTEVSTTKYLVGYYVLDNENSGLSQSIIVNGLSRILPDYMVPAGLVEMESFPLTINGKLDKQALPDPEFTTSDEEYVAPTSETEAKICKIWEEALRLDRVGVTDNFFRIGGNSILAIQVSHRMSKTLGSDVNVADIFKLKNIQLLMNNLSVKRVNPDNVEWDVLIDS